MTYSKRNPAYGRLMRNRANDRVNEEARIANDLQANDPAIKRADALRAAAAILDRESKLP